MAEYKDPTLDKLLGGVSTGIGTAATLASTLGSTAATGLMGATMAGLLTNPFTAPIAAVLPFAAKLFGPGADGPKQVAATNLVEKYNKSLEDRTKLFKENQDKMTDQQKLQFVFDQKNIVNNMLSDLEKYRKQLGDKVTNQSIADRIPGARYDPLKDHVLPFTGGKSIEDYASSLGLEVPTKAGNSIIGNSGGGSSPLNLPSASSIFGNTSKSGTTSDSLNIPKSSTSMLGPLLSNGAAMATNALSGGNDSMLNFGNIFGGLKDLFGNKTFQSILGAALPAATSILGSVGQRASNDNANETLQQGLGDLLSRSDAYGNLAGEQQAAVMQSIQELLQTGGMGNLFNGLQGDIASTGSNLASLFQGNLADPKALSLLQSSLEDPRIQSALSNASDATASGGLTPSLAQALLSGNSLLTGSSGQQMQTQATADDLLKNGGLTPFLESILGASSGALASRGMTPEIQAALAPLLQMTQSGGKTAENMEMFGRGMDLFNREALLPMSTAIGMARGEAGNSIRQQAEAARREAQNRGGGPGAVVGAGSANDARADFANDAAALVGQATRSAMGTQQGLQLQQQATGANAAGTALGEMASRLGIGTSGVSNLLGTAANRESALGSLGSAAQQQATGRTGLGIDALNTIVQQALSGGNLVTGATNSAINRLGTGLSGTQGLGQLQSSGYNNILEALLSGSNLATQRGSATANAIGNNQELLSRNEIARSSNITNLLQLLSGLSGQNLGAAGTALGAGSSLYTPLASGQRNSPLSDALTAAGKGIGDALQGWNNNKTTTTPRGTSTSPTS